MATLTESITPVAMAANNGQFIAYERSFVAGTPYEVVNGKPVQWFEWVCRSVDTTTDANVFNDGGYLRAELEFTNYNTLLPQVGDYVFLDLTPAQTQFAQITRVDVASETAITVLTDIVWASQSIGATSAVDFYLVNRLNRLRPFYITDGTRRYEPNYSAIFVNDETDPTEAIAIDHEQIAISWFPAARPFIDAANANRNVDLSVGYGKIGNAYDETDAVSVSNALEFGLVFDVLFNSNILNGKLYRNQWQLANCKVIEASPYMSSTPNTSMVIFNVINDPFATGYPTSAPVKLNLASRNPIWLAWQSRYGGYDVWAFNYDQTETLRTESYGQYRQGYSVYDLGKQGATTYTLNTGLISNEYKEWFEDLQNSNKVWFAFDVIIAQDGTINYINHDATNWQECTVEDMATILGTANSKLIEFQPTIRIPELSKAYRS